MKKLVKSMTACVGLVLVTCVSASAGVGTSSSTPVSIPVYGDGTAADIHAPVTSLSVDTTVSARQLVKGGVEVSLTSDENAVGRVDLITQSVTASGSGSSVRPVASKSVSLASNSSINVKLRISPKQLKRLRSVSTHRLTVVFNATDPSGNRAAALTRSLRLSL